MSQAVRWQFRLVGVNKIFLKILFKERNEMVYEKHYEDEQ